MRTCGWVVGVVAVLGIFAAAPLKSDEKTGGPAEDGFVPLFAEGGVPKGWVVRAWDDVAKTAPEGARWRVDADGVLHGSDPRGTWLVSEQQYADFELAFEFLLPERGNGGCGLRFPGRGDPAFDGLELQMLDPRYHGDDAANVGPDELTGSLYKAIAPREQVFKPGEWNAYRIRCQGPHVRVELNGKMVVDANLDEHAEKLGRGVPLRDRPRTGHIGFQELSRGGGHVQVRNARLKVLDAGSGR